MIPFRSQPPAPRLPDGYRLLENCSPAAEALNRLLALMGDPPRSPERWARVLERSLWHFGVVDPSGQLVGFVRITTNGRMSGGISAMIFCGSA